MVAVAPDLVVVGGVVADRTPSGLVPGGAAFYATRAALALGARVAVLTHARTDLDVLAALAGADIMTSGRSSVTFTNTYTPAGREQQVEGDAPLLDLARCPPGWRAAGAVLLAPVYHEVPGEVREAFSGTVLGIAPQGWMRRADAVGRVFPVPWSPSSALLKRAALVSLSEEDLGRDAAAERELASRCRLLVVTRGASGCTVYACGLPAGVSGFAADEVDPTGAGDVFAAALLLRLTQNGNPHDAAVFANATASFAVEAPGVTGLPTRDQVLERMAHHQSGERR